MPRSETDTDRQVAALQHVTRAENLQLPLMAGRIAHLRTSPTFPGAAGCPALTGRRLPDLRAARRTRDLCLRDSRLRSAMDLACTCDKPRVYLTGDPGATAPRTETMAAAHHPGRSLGCVSSDPSTCAFSPYVTLCIAMGRGLAGRPVAMINYVRTDEQTWSNHDPETAADQVKGIVKRPGQEGCAARDSNPEPAD